MSFLLFKFISYSLALALLMARVRADNANTVATLDRLAFHTDFFY